MKIFLLKYFRDVWYFFINLIIIIIQIFRCGKLKFILLFNHQLLPFVNFIIICLELFIIIDKGKRSSISWTHFIWVYEFIYFFILLDLNWYLFTLTNHLDRLFKVIFICLGFFQRLWPEKHRTNKVNKDPCYKRRPVY